MPTATARPALTRGHYLCATCATTTSSCSACFIPQQRLQQVSEVVHQQPHYPEPRFQPPSSVTRIQQHKMIGHPTSMFQPPRGGPPPQAPTNLTPYNQQYIPGLTYPSLGQPNLSGYQPQPLHVPQLPIPGTQQQPPPSGAPQPHYNQPSARQKEYNSDYYGRQRRSDPRHKYTGDSDTSYVSAYRQTRTKRRSEPEYNRPHENQQRDFSPLRSVRSFPLHRSRSSPRRSRGSSDSQSESDTDMQSSTSSQENTGQSVHKEPTSQQVSFNENNKDDFYDSEGVVSGIGTVRSLGAAKLFRVEVKIAGKKVLALVDSGSEVTIIKDTFVDTLEPKPFVIRRPPSPVSCDMILGCDFIMHNRVVLKIRELIVTVQNRDMPLILGGENITHEPNVNVVHGKNTSDSYSDSSSDEKPRTEGSTQRFPASRQSAEFHFETVIPQVESNLGMMASTSTHESEERGTQEEPDQCRDNRDQCCINKEETRETLGFYTCPKSGKKERTCIQSRTDRKCPVKNCPVVVDRRDVKRHCFEEHLSEIFQTYHSKRLMEDRRFHQHRAYVVMLIAKWLTRQETVTAKDLVNFLNEKSFVPRSTHVTGIQMQIHRTVCKEMGWTDYFRYSLRPVNSPACLLNWRVLTSVLHFLTPEQQDMVAEGFNYNPRNTPETEELAQMNANFWPVFVNKTQVESAILQKEGEEDNFVSEQEERTIVMDERIYYESESIEDNDTDTHHTPENENAILLGHQVSQLAESQVEPSSSQLKSRQSLQVPTIVVIQYGGLQCMASVSSMTELYKVVTERFPESGNVSLICEGSVLDGMF
ncbi:unnamed protein product [Mytilus edulis]|uniref:Peptidase A2 domain-containing protein n=1 Tax=Mytilus edulis TaxID=6550 RepID=A0A8S3QYJ6_MYTED|nr:unnamed protein product [Mytilus edulis]